MTRLSVKALTLTVLILGISSQAAKADVDLTDGIRAFICEGETFVLEEKKEGWFSSSGLELSNTSDGWRWLENDGSVYLSERKPSEWVVEQLSPKGYRKSECIDITASTAEVVSVTKSRINENIGKIEAENDVNKQLIVAANLENFAAKKRINQLKNDFYRLNIKNIAAKERIAQLSKTAATLSKENVKLKSQLPLSEKVAIALSPAVQQCWNVGSLSSLALETTVVVALSLTQDGKPLVSSIRLVSSEGGTSASVKQAFETARRAIIRCGARGFDLPSDEYDQWKDLEMTFDPKGMRIK